MNRQEWEEQVFNSDLNPTARMVCLAIGSHGNWTKEQTVWPTRQRIAGMVGTSRDNVGKYMTALEEQGWLKVVKIRKDNIREYELSTPNQVVVDYGILGVKSRGSKAKLNHQVVVVDEQVVVSNDKQVVVDNGQVVVNYDSNLKNLPVEPTIEPTNREVPASPVQLEESEVVEDTTTSPNLPDSPMVTSAGASVTVSSLGNKISPNGESSIANSADAPLAVFNKREMVEAYISGTRWISDITEEQKQAIKEKTLDTRWNPGEVRPNHRVQDAVKEVFHG